MKILISTSSFDVTGSQPLRLLEAQGFEIVTNPHRRRLTENEVRALLTPDTIGMVAGVEPLTGEVLKRAKGLKVISRCGVGLDSIDLQTARALGIHVFNTPDAPSTAVAELTLALMLGTLRRISEADQNIRRGVWRPLMGSLLNGKTVGLIGLGRIGTKVGRFVAAFGCRVLAYDVRVPNLEAGARLCGLDELLREADIVSLHLPYGTATHHLMDKKRIAQMKRGAVLINASRGGLVEETALLDALKSGHLSGAAVDTFEQEPYDGPLAKMPQVLLTAHMGSYAYEARAGMEAEAAENLVRGLAECETAAPAVTPEHRGS